MRSQLKTYGLESLLSVYTPWPWEPPEAERRQVLWIATIDVVETLGNALYDQLNQILDEHKFDAKVETADETPTRCFGFDGSGGELAGQLKQRRVCPSGLSACRSRR